MNIISISDLYRHYRSVDLKTLKIILPIYGYKAKAYMQFQLYLAKNTLYPEMST
jgi:hypothetical protein